MRVIGTAGHVDHGKSTLVEALTGIDPDRLKEEKEREMTIDLGFAWLTLPSGETVSIVDVPGHEDFIKNMLAGVGGIDAALFVVAADEGVMPQTREHLAILDLLHIENAIVALTKTDLAEDEEWVELVKEDVADTLKGTSLAGAVIVPVSARTGAGLDDLLAELDRVLARTIPRRDLGRPRLPIDRVFTIAGFGTVVTGTLIDGRLQVGQEVEILPQGLKSRIRGLQTHRQKRETAAPGSRVAVNLTGVSTGQLARGNVLTTPGWLRPTLLIDVQIEMLEDAPRPLRHNVEVGFFSGSAEITARTRLLGTQAIPPGERGWAQLRLAEPAVVIKNDRFIIRQPSPGLTIGGGIIVDPYPRRRHRRFRPEVIERLETLAHGTPEEILLQTLERRQPCDARELFEHSNLARSAAEDALRGLLGEGRIVVLDTEEAETDVQLHSIQRSPLMTASGWADLTGRMTDLLAAYHRHYPLRGGMPREEMKSRLRLDTKLFNIVVARAARGGVIAETESAIHLPDHEVRFTPEQQARVDRLLDRFAQNPYTTPSVTECEALVGADVLGALIEGGRLTRVNEDVIFLTSTYGQMVDRIVAHIRREGSVTVAQVRDMFGASRKYALGLMEHLDDRRVTRRVGDVRILR